MKRWLKVGLFLFLIVVTVVLVGAGWYIGKAIPLGTGYAAKYLCSSVYISHRDPETVFREDIAPVHFLYKIIKAHTTVENGIKSAEARSLGLSNPEPYTVKGVGVHWSQGLPMRC